MLDHYLLSLLIWLPMLGGVLALAVGGDHYPNRARVIALVTSLISIVLCAYLFWNFDTTTSVMQFQEHIPWITAYDINYSLGIDGISLLLILLTNFTTLLVILEA
jgi:NADH-quinone oxidoreductase subunit M